MKLHDIKPLVELNDYSFYYFVVFMVAVVVVVVALIYLIYRYVKNHKRVNVRKEHYKILKQLNLTNTKESAYALTHYGSTFIEDSQRVQRAYEKMNEHLSKYKYKKDVEPFDDETQHEIDMFLGMIDV